MGMIDLTCAPRKTIVEKIGIDTAADLHLNKLSQNVTREVIERAVVSVCAHPSAVHRISSCFGLNVQSEAEQQCAIRILRPSEATSQVAGVIKDSSRPAPQNASNTSGSLWRRCDLTGASDSYSSSLMRRLLHGLELTGINEGTARVEDLVGADADQFHLGGRGALKRACELLELAPFEHVIHVGCGIGGAARHIATQCAGVRVTGLEANAEYARVARDINSWPGIASQLEGRVTIQEMDLKKLPDASVNKVLMINAGMAAQEKVHLARQLCRVLKPGGRLVMLETVASNMEDAPAGTDVNKHLVYPLPWAESLRESHVCRLHSHRVAFQVSGFTPVTVTECKAGKQRSTLAARLKLGLNAEEKQANYSAMLACGHLLHGEMVFEKHGMFLRVPGCGLP